MEILPLFFIPVALAVLTFSICYIFSYKTIVGKFDQWAKCNFVPPKRISWYLIYAPLTFLGICAMPALILLPLREMIGLSNEPIAICLGIILFYICWHFAMRKFGRSGRAAFFILLHNILLAYTICMFGAALYFIGILALVLAAFALVIYIIVGGTIGNTGERIRVKSKDTSTEKELTVGLDGELHDTSGTTYHKDGNTYTPQS